MLKKVRGCGPHAALEVLSHKRGRHPGQISMFCSNIKSKLERDEPVGSLSGSRSSQPC